MGRGVQLGINLPFSLFFLNIFVQNCSLSSPSGGMLQSASKVLEMILLCAECKSKTIDISVFASSVKYEPNSVNVRGDLGGDDVCDAFCLTRQRSSNAVR